MMSPPPRKGGTRSNNGAGKIHCGGGFRAVLGGSCPRGRRRGIGGGQGVTERENSLR